MKEKLLRKRPRELKIDDDTFYVRSMTLAESLKSDELGKSPDNYMPMIDYVLSACVVDPNGKPVFQSESDPDIHEIPTDVAYRLVEEIRKATRPASTEAVLKN
jgi:hypothetical protein